MNLFFWRKKEEASDAYVPYEEIDSKRTSKLGYFFLILMVIFGIWQGNQFLEAVQRGVDRPVVNSSCSARLADLAENDSFGSRYYYYSNSDTCSFSEREIRLGLDTAYNTAKPLFLRVENLETQIDSLQRQLSALSREKEETLDEYQTALIEEISATGSAQLNQQALGTGYTTKKQTIAQINGQISRLTSDKSRTEQELVALANTYSPLLTQADDEYRLEVKKYQFLLFIISIVLVGPVFYFAWYHYHQARLKRSEYTIIWGGAVATFGFILAQILLIFVYEILPQGILEAIFSFLAVFEFLWTLLYFLSFILVPLFFGFLIYIIQKKLYNKKAVLMRTLKSGHCPSCSLKISPDMNHCPICGYHIKTKCSACGHMTLDGGKFCSVCGNKHETPAS